MLPGKRDKKYNLKKICGHPDKGQQGLIPFPQNRHILVYPK
jgi:hypothetical protein